MPSFLWYILLSLFSHSISMALMMSIVCHSVKGKKWLRMKITHHLKVECPHYILKCDYARMGCKHKSQRCQMRTHLQFECEYRMVQCPFTQYGCSQTAKMHYHELTKHLKEYEMKHMALKLVHVCDQMKSIETNVCSELLCTATSILKQ